VTKLHTKALSGMDVAREFNHVGSAPHGVRGVAGAGQTGFGVSLHTNMTLVGTKSNHCFWVDELVKAPCSARKEM